MNTWIAIIFTSDDVHLVALPDAHNRSDGIREALTYVREVGVRPLEVQVEEWAA